MGPKKKAGADAKLHTADLDLARACASGDAKALATFEAELMAQIPTHVGRFDSSPAFADEVKALLREKLFAGPAPKIASYSGRGPLGGWLRVAAIRVAQNLLRGKSASSSSPKEAATADPEVEFFKRRYGKLFRDVLETVLMQLPHDQRAVLRLHFVDGLTVRAIGTMYHVNASTITRWIAQTREHIMDQTRTRLREQLAIDDRELDSVLALVKSKIDLTLSRVLAPHASAIVSK